MSEELKQLFENVNDILNTLVDSSESQDLQMGIKLNELVKMMKSAEEGFDREFHDVTLPFSLIEDVDKKISDNCIEEILKTEFQEADTVSTELKEASRRLKDLAKDLFM